MKERPTSVTVFAVLNLLLCALGLLFTLLWLVGKLGLIPEPPEKPPFQLAMEAQTGFTLYTDVVTVLGILITILVVSASIGMFTLKPWSRKLTIGWSIYTLIFLPVNFIISYFLLYGPLLANLTGQDQIIVKFMVGGGIVTSLLLIGYHALMLFMLTRPHVGEAFTPELMDDHGNWEPSSQPGDMNP